MLLPYAPAVLAGQAMSMPSVERSLNYTVGRAYPSIIICSVVTSFSLKVVGYRRMFGWSRQRESEALACTACPHRKNSPRVASYIQPRSSHYSSNINTHSVKSAASHFSPFMWPYKTRSRRDRRMYLSHTACKNEFRRNPRSQLFYFNFFFK